MVQQQVAEPAAPVTPRGGLVVVYTALMLAILVAALDQTIVSTEGIGAAPTERSSVAEVERALCRLADADMRRRGYERLAAMAELDLPGGSCWVLTRLAKQGPVAGPDLAEQAHVTVEYGRPYVARLVDAGLVVRADGMLALTGAGNAAADRLFAARREALCMFLQGFNPEQHADLAAMLTQLSRELLGADADRSLITR